MVILGVSILRQSLRHPKLQPMANKRRIIWDSRGPSTKTFVCVTKRHERLICELIYELRFASFYSPSFYSQRRLRLADPEWTILNAAERSSNRASKCCR